MRRVFLCGLIALCWALGCSTKPGTNYQDVTLLSVTGTVTLDGQPLPKAVVTFETEGQGTFSYAMTDDAGQYELRFDSEMKGCTPGRKRVEISTTRKILGLNTSEEGAAPSGEGGGEGPAVPSEKEQVPAKYNKKSELIAEVSASAVTHNFDLKSK